MLNIFILTLKNQVVVLLTLNKLMLVAFHHIMFRRFEKFDSIAHIRSKINSLSHRLKIIFLVLLHTRCKPTRLLVSTKSKLVFQLINLIALLFDSQSQVLCLFNNLCIAFLNLIFLVVIVFFQ